MFEKKYRKIAFVSKNRKTLLKKKQTRTIKKNKNKIKILFFFRVLDLVLEALEKAPLNEGLLELLKTFNAKHIASILGFKYRNFRSRLGDTDKDPTFTDDDNKMQQNNNNNNISDENDKPQAMVIDKSPGRKDSPKSRTRDRERGGNRDRDRDRDDRHSHSHSHRERDRDRNDGRSDRDRDRERDRDRDRSYRRSERHGDKDRNSSRRESKKRSISGAENGNGDSNMNKHEAFKDYDESLIKKYNYVPESLHVVAVVLINKQIIELKDLMGKKREICIFFFVCVFFVVKCVCFLGI